MKFAGKNALITGAASGIGLACALELARRGAGVALADIDENGLEEAVQKVLDLGGRALPLVVDLSKADAVAALAERALEELGTIDLLLNNAGVAVAAPLLETRDSDWEWIFSVNVWAPIRLTRALLPHMIARRSGHIVMTASLAGLVGAPGMPAYSTTKFALVGFAEALRLEVADEGIDVTVACPGYVRTNLHRATRYSNDGFERFLDAPPSWYGLSKERAGEIIADAIEKKDPLAVFGMEKIGWWIKRVSPQASFAVSRWVARRAGILTDAKVAPGLA